MADVFIVIPFVFCTLRLLENSYIDKILIWVGKYSTYAWLTHTFFCYYYFQNIIVLTKLSILMFIETVVLSIITGIVLTYIDNIIHKIKDHFHNSFFRN